MRPSSNREFENHFRVFPSAVRVDAIRIVFRDSAESFIPCTVLRTARAGRSAEDRLLCKQEALGSNPSRSIPEDGHPVPFQLKCSPRASDATGDSRTIPIHFLLPNSNTRGVSATNAT